METLKALEKNHGAILKQRGDYYRLNREKLLFQANQRAKRKVQEKLEKDSLYIQKLLDQGKRKVKLTNSLKISIFASLLVSEGYVGVHQCGEKGRKVLHPNLGITNTDFRIISFCKCLFPFGKVYEYTDPNPRHKKIYHFCIGGLLNVLTTLSKVRPYLITKEKESDLVMEFCASRLLTPWKERAKFQECPRRAYNKRESEIYHLLKEIHGGNGGNGGKGWLSESVPLTRA